MITWGAGIRWIFCCRKRDESVQHNKLSINEQEVPEQCLKYYRGVKIPDNDQLDEMFEQLKALLKKHGCMENRDLPYEELQQFLHSNDYNVKKAAHTACRNNELKSTAPQLFGNRDPLQATVQSAWTLLNIFTLPERMKDKSILMYIGLQDQNPKHFVMDMDEAVKLFSIAVEGSAMLEPQAPGYIVILDAKGFTMDHAPMSKIQTLKAFIKYIKEAMPVKVFQIHVINVNEDARKMYSILGALYQKNLANKVIFHCQEKKGTLLKYIPAKLLPKELGGNKKTIDDLQRVFKTQIEDIAIWFQVEQAAYKMRKGKAGKTVKKYKEKEPVKETSQHSISSLVEEDDNQLSSK